MPYDPNNPLQDRITDIGPRYYRDFFPPVIEKNFGKWLYHDILEPGVMVHVAESGDKLFTVRAASPRLMSVNKIRAYCDLADKYCDGYFRFTSRNNVEFLVVVKSNRIEQLIEFEHAVRLIVVLQLQQRIRDRRSLPRPPDRAEWRHCGESIPG